MLKPFVYPRKWNAVVTLMALWLEFVHQLHFFLIPSSFRQRLEVTILIVPCRVLKIVELPTSELFPSPLVSRKHLRNTVIFLQLYDHITPISAHEASPELITQDVDAALIINFNIVVMYLVSVFRAHLHDLLCQSFVLNFTRLQSLLIQE